MKLRFWQRDTPPHSRVKIMRDKTTPDRMDITTVEIEADAPYEELLKRAKEQTD